MSRTIIEIPQALLHEADDLCARLGISRAELVRRALRDFLRGQQPVKAEGFGLWTQSAVRPEVADAEPGRPKRRRRGV
ncbi:MAG: CopG family ribbon-helix-helix protein [Betaproteobacteria bacterium]|nr:ribbon-helix-helix protein, CopG family [Betaproteobacteria bacterium]